jgi:hypothetical protein
VLKKKKSTGSQDVHLVPKEWLCDIWCQGALDEEERFTLMVNRDTLQQITDRWDLLVQLRELIGRKMSQEQKPKAEEIFDLVGRLVPQGWFLTF